MIEYTVQVREDRTEWRLNGKLHRVDGPAKEWADGDKSWHLNGELHRVDGPAIEYSDGYKAWWLNGKRHRVDGPAMEHVNVREEWYIDGVKLTEAEFLAKTAKEYTVADLEKLLGHSVKIVK